MIIRKETKSDIEAITQITIAAFRTLPISNHTEQFIIKALRALGALTLFTILHNYCTSLQRVILNANMSSLCY